jgi:hypothetical protein
VSGSGPGSVPLFVRGSDSAGFIIERTPTNRWVLGVNESPTLGNGFVLSTIPTGNTSIPRLMITQDGNVGIGTTDPGARLEVETTNEIGIHGSSNNMYGVYGESSSGNGVRGHSDTTSAVSGHSNSGNGVYGQCDYSGGYSQTANGVYGYSLNGNGVKGESSSNGYAGLFVGNVQISGILLKGTDFFKIDHPLDPENRFLQHSVVESPDIKNIYDGIIILDEKGEAVVEMPAYFEALNRDFRYQLTCIGEPAVLCIAEKMSNNHFKIAGGKPGMEVSWQITGIRKDAFAMAHPLIVEQQKPTNEQGYYLHPIEWGQPAEKGISSLSR